MKLSLRSPGWKVPFRAVYCDTFRTWVRATVWCHFVIRIFPHAVDLGSDSLVDVYLETPKEFFRQYSSHLVEIAIERGASR